MAGAKADARWTGSYEQWSAWTQPGEKNKPGKQIKRIVAEWADLSALLPLLKEIHPDPKIAAGMAVGAYRLTSGQSLQVAAQPAAPEPPAGDEQDPFSQDCF